MKLARLPTIKPSRLYQLLVWVEVFTVSTGHSEILPLFIPVPCVQPRWHTAATSHPTAGCGRGENSSPLQSTHCASVLGSLSLSLLEVCTLELFLLVLLMSHGAKVPGKHWNSSSAFIYEQAPKSLGKNLQQSLISVSNMIWFIHLVYMG